VLSVRHSLKFPNYIQKERIKAGLPPTVEDLEGGNVEAIEGTVVEVKAETNEEAESGNLLLSYKDERGERKAPRMDRDPDNHYHIAGNFRVAGDGTYSIRFTTLQGKTNPRPVEYDIKSLPDRKPTAQFIRPEPSIKVPSNGRVALRMKAADDHGLQEMTLHVVQGRELLQAAKNYLEQREPVAEIVQDDLIELESLGVKAGTKIEYWLSVRDSREPQANRFETPHQVIEVEAPLPPEQKQEQHKAAEEQLKNPPPPQPGNQQPPPTEDQQPQPTDEDQQQTPDKPSQENGKQNDGQEQQSRPADQPQDSGQKLNGDQQDQPSRDDEERLKQLEQALQRQQQDQPPKQGAPQEREQEKPRGGNKEVDRNQASQSGEPQAKRQTGDKQSQTDEARQNDQKQQSGQGEKSQKEQDNDARERQASGTDQVSRA
jgi:hypothetical protein